MLRIPASERNFIIITLLLVMALGAQTVSSLLQDDMVDRVADGSVPVAGPDRAPASLGSSEAPVKKSLSQLVDLDLSCTKKLQKELSISGSFVQLKGKNCLKGFKEGQIQIVNQSNGYTASIFAFGRNRYQTDLIQLREGENQIMIRHQSKNGSVFEQTLNVRASAI